MLITMRIELVTLVAIAANVLGGAMALPQAWKLVRSRRVQGISPSWAAISVAVNAWWIAYGIGVDDVGIVPVSIVSVIAYIGIAVALLRYGMAPTVRTAVVMIGVGVAAAVVPLATLVFGGWTAAGIAMGALYGVQLSPAVVAVYREPDVSGVSAATWAIACAEAVLWGLYGLVRVDQGLVSLAVTGTLMSVLVLVRLVVRRPRRGARDDRGDLAGLGLAVA